MGGCLLPANLKPCGQWLSLGAPTRFTVRDIWSPADCPGNSGVSV